MSATVRSNSCRRRKQDWNARGCSGRPLPQVAAIIAILVELGGGLMLVAGFKARWAALALGLFTLAASLMFHRFWDAPADQQLVQQLLFTKNMAIVGGLLFLAGVGPGMLSVDSEDDRSEPRRQSALPV